MTHSWSVWAYGSVARGDSDGLSDVDILAVGPPHEEPSRAVAAVGLQGKAVSMSRYSWDEMQSMADYGSLFLQHVRLEGHALYEGESVRGKLDAILAELGEYRLARRDLRGFKVVLADVAESLAHGGSAPFELSTLATVVRHASILGCWLIGTPTFGRLSPVQSFTTALDEAVSVNDFEPLYMYRLYCDGRLDRSALPAVVVDNWLAKAQRLVEALEEVLDGRRKVLA